MPTLLISALSDIAFLKKTLHKIPENSENYNNYKKLPKIMENHWIWSQHLENLPL